MSWTRPPEVTAALEEYFRTAPPAPLTGEIVMDLTPTWWERERIIQRVRH